MKECELSNSIVEKLSVQAQCMVRTGNYCGSTRQLSEFPRVRENRRIPIPFGEVGDWMTRVYTDDYAGGRCFVGDLGRGVDNVPVCSSVKRDAGCTLLRSERIESALRFARS